MIFSYIFRGGKRTENDKTNIKILEFMRLLPFVCIIPQRHTFTSMWAEKHLDEGMRRKIQGHSGKGIGEIVYTHLEIQTLKAELDKL